MSILIKGMEMPDSCLNCRFRATILKNVLSPTMRTSVYACLINGMEINNWYEEKHKDCPLVEVPTPHGRLIDADALLSEIRYGAEIRAFCNKCKNQDCQNCLIQSIDAIIRNSQTIIEAEI